MNGFTSVYDEGKAFSFQLFPGMSRSVKSTKVGQCWGCQEDVD